MWRWRGWWGCGAGGVRRQRGAAADPLLPAPCQEANPAALTRWRQTGPRYLHYLPSHTTRTQHHRPGPRPWAPAWESALDLLAVEVIDNLEQDPEYYQRTLTFALRVDDPPMQAPGGPEVLRRDHPCWGWGQQGFCTK